MRQMHRIISMVLLFAVLLKAQIHETTTISSPGCLSFTVAKNNSTGENLIVAYRYDGGRNKLYLSVYGKRGQTLLNAEINEQLQLFSESSGSSSAVIGQDMYCFFGKKVMYRLHTAPLQIDTIPLNHSRYSALRYLRYVYAEIVNKRKVVVYDFFSGIDIYDSRTGELMYTFNKEFENKGIGSKPILFHNRIIFLNKKNELICRDLQSQKTVWKYNAGEEKVKVLGISIASVEDGISQCLLLSGPQEFLLVNTYSGDMVLINPNNGDVIRKREKFRGNTEYTDKWTGRLMYMVQDRVPQTGNKVVFGAGKDKNLYAINTDNLSANWSYLSDAEFSSPIAGYDVSGDEIPDIFSCNNNGRLVVVNGANGSVLFDRYAGNCGSRVVLCDFDGNGKLDMILNPQKDLMKIFELPNVSVTKNYLPVH